MTRRSKKRRHKKIEPCPATRHEENEPALEIAKTLVNKPELIPDVLNEPRVAALIVQQKGAVFTGWIAGCLNTELEQIGNEAFQAGLQVRSLQPVSSLAKVSSFGCGGST